MEINRSILIGDRNEFAIEYQVNKNNGDLFGNICLWIGNIKIGYYEEEVLLLVAKSALERLLENIGEINRSNLAGKNKEDLFKQIYSIEDANGIYLISPGESFDDFSFFAFSHEDTLYFCWKLHEDPFFDYDDYPKDIQLKTVPISVYKNVLQQWAEQLKQ